MTQSPRLETIVEDAAAGANSGVWTMLPARVERFDSGSCVVDAQPMVWQQHEEEDGTEVSERMAVIPCCPVVFQGGPGGRITCPVAVGDLGMLVFASCSMDRFLATGNDVDPKDGEEQKNTLNNAFFLHGVHHLASGDGGPPSSYDDDAVVIAVPDGKFIKLGSKSATQNAIRGTDFANDLNTFFDALDTWGQAVGIALGITFSPVGTAIFDAALHLSGKVALE